MSGEDDAENELEGVPDDVCPNQLKTSCEILLKSGRRISTIEELDNMDTELEVDEVLQDVLDNSSTNISIDLLDSSSLVSEVGPSKSSAKKRRVGIGKGVNSKTFPRIWNVNDSKDNMIAIFPDANYEDCRGLKPHELFEKFFDDEVLQLIIEKYIV